MNGVDDDRHAGARGGEASEDAGFAAVGVNDVRPGAAENFGELPQRACVLPGMNGADEFGQHGEQTGIFRETIFERTFRAGGWTGDEIDFEAGLFLQSEDGGDGVFLRTADDQTGDDVSDAHAGSGLEGRVLFELG